MKITFDEEDAVDLLRGKSYVDALMGAGFVLMVPNADGKLVRFVGFNIREPPPVLIVTDLLRKTW